MRKKKGTASKIFNILFIVAVCIALKFIYDIYKENNFGDFSKAEYIANISEFKRDNQIKENKHDSYRITSKDFNDAMFYKKVSVTPNTPYRVSCMVKTKNVETQKNVSNAGAGICIADTTECSNTVQGTQDWQKIEFLFNSKNRTEVEIGFRLGSYADNCKGTAWFSDLQLEVGSESQDTNWNMVCFIFRNLDVTIEKGGVETRIQESMTELDVSYMKDNMERLKDSFKQLSNYQMTMEYEIIEITEPITAVSYDEENGYYVSSSDVAHIIEPYVQQEKYDYIYAAIKLGEYLHDDSGNKSTWIGLRRNGL